MVVWVLVGMLRVLRLRELHGSLIRMRQHGAMRAPVVALTCSTAIAQVSPRKRQSNLWYSIQVKITTRGRHASALLLLQALPIQAMDA